MRETAGQGQRASTRKGVGAEEKKTSIFASDTKTYSGVSVFLGRPVTLVGDGGAVTPVFADGCMVSASLTALCYFCRLFLHDVRIEPKRG